MVIIEAGLETLPEGRVLCTKCGKSYSTMTNARRHVNDAHMPTQQVRCQLCFRTFSKKRYRNDHYRSFHGISLSELPVLQEFSDFNRSDQKGGSDKTDKTWLGRHIMHIIFLMYLNIFILVEMYVQFIIEVYEIIYF